MNYLLIIPARFESKRFKGKPLKKINGKEMISYVWDACVSAIGKKNVVIATDSIKISNFCLSKGYNCIITSNKCLTGTDRIYEVSKKIKKDFYSLNVPKVVFDNNKNLLYMSRSNIPGNKKNSFLDGYKQVCIYSFPYKELQSFGKNKRKTQFENSEDIEILRFIELGIKVKMFEVSQSSIGVDTIEDLKRVEKIIKKNDKCKL